MGDNLHRTLTALRPFLVHTLNNFEISSKRIHPKTVYHNHCTQCWLA